MYGSQLSGEATCHGHRAAEALQRSISWRRLYRTDLMRGNFSEQLSALILTLPAPDGHDAFRTLVNPDDLEKKHPISDCSQALLHLQFTQLAFIVPG